MGLFSFLKKDKAADNKQEELPPMPSDMPPPSFGDLPPIKAPDMPTMPHMPEAPDDGFEQPGDDMPALEETHAEDEEQYHESPPSEPDIPEETMPEAEEPEKHEDYGPSMFPKRPIMPQTRQVLMEQQDDGSSSPMSSDFVTPMPKPSIQPVPREAKALPSHKMSIPDLENIPGDRPLFVRADLYADAIAAIEDIKRNLRDADEVLFRSRSLRDEMDKEYSKWHDNLEDIQRKIVLVDQSLFE